jgi:hypothetical protein
MTTLVPGPDSGPRAPAHRRLGRPPFRRSYDLRERLTTFFVSAVATVLLTRSFLAATGYPQVGNSSLHIAHVLWGGLLLTASLIATLAALSPDTKPIAAVAGGIGFGLFIDEIGKFVTKDVNYFYKPAIAIIYVCFVVLFGVIRWLARRGFGADEAVLIGLDSLQHAAVGTLTDERRAETLELLGQTGASGPLADGVRELLEHAAATDEHPSRRRRLMARLRQWWRLLSGHPRFHQLVYAVLVVVAAISIAETAWLLRHGVGDLTFSQRAFTLTTIVADAMLIAGAVALTRSTLAALHWYEHAVLLEITVGQVFLYASEQLAATADLIGLLFLWALIHTAIGFEKGATAQREIVAERPSALPPAS